MLCLNEPLKTSLHRTMKNAITLILLGTTLLCSGFSTAGSIKKDESLLFFPSNAYWNSITETWVIPIKGWVFEAEEDSYWRNLSLKALAKILEVKPDSTSSALFKRRTQMFLVDNERGKEITVELLGKRQKMSESGSNGHFKGTLLLDHELKETTGSSYSDTVNHWLSYKAILQKDDHRQFEGKVRLIAPQGVSVISDIDDTIKISNVKDKQALLQNTFLKPFKAVPGMANIYQLWAQKGAAFHYLSASPWHLYPAMKEFITSSGFPEGSFNLKHFRVKDETFFNLFTSQVNYKKPIIESFFKQYPHRRFILVGDAGEQYPEIFADIARMYPQQLVHIFIRDPSASANNSARYLSSFAGIPEQRWSIFNDNNLQQRLLKLNW